MRELSRRFQQRTSTNEHLVEPSGEVPSPCAVPSGEVPSPCADPEAEYIKKIGNDLMGVSSWKTPVDAELLWQEAHHQVGHLGTDKQQLGFTRRLQPVRTAFIEQ